MTSFFAIASLIGTLAVGRAAVALAWHGPLRESGTATLAWGAAYPVGVLVVCAWLRALAAAGIAWSSIIALVPVVVAVGVLAWLWRTAGVAPLLAAARAIAGAGLGGAARVGWLALLAWLALRFAFVLTEVLARPPLPWEAWLDTAARGSVWHALRALVDFVPAAQWNGDRYLAALPQGHSLLPLLDVFTALIVGRFDDTVVHAPWPMFWLSQVLLVYGAMRAAGASALPALVAATLVGTLPLANAHAALGGTAALPLATYLLAAAIFTGRAAATRALPDALLALAAIAGMVWVSRAGALWLPLLLPIVAAAVRPAQALLHRGRIGRGGRDCRKRARTPRPVRAGHHAGASAGHGRTRRAGAAARQLASARLRGHRACRAGLAALARTRTRRPERRRRRRPRGARRLRDELRRPRHHRPGRHRRSRRHDVRAAARALGRAGRVDLGARLTGRRGNGSGRAGRGGGACGCTPDRVRRRRASLTVLSLPGVTLACIDTANHALALRALERSRAGIRFARAMLLTDAMPEGLAVPAGIDVVPIGRIASRDDYSRFVLKHLADHVATPHVLLVQWDGYVVNPAAWDDAFLDCDYLGARWFWHTDGHDVGNGGFSLRSLRLLQALRDPRIELVEAEDLTIGRTFRDLLEREHGIRFGDAALADRFAFEAAYPVGTPFGFHGLFNFCRVVPPAELAALVPAFSDAIARSPQLAQLLRNCVALGQWAPAIAIAKRALVAAPGHGEAERLLAQSEAALAAGAGVGRNDPCPCGSGKRYKQCHGAVGVIVPAALSPDALVARAVDAHRRGDLDAAERDYRTALDAAPEHPYALHYLGVVDYQRGRLADALPRLTAAVDRLPAEPEFHNNLGLVLAALDRHDEAIAAHRRALALQPVHAGAWNNLGLALTAANALDDAIAALDRALELAPTLTEARFNRALALLAAGRFAEGFRDYEARLAVPAFADPAWSPTVPRWDGSEAPRGRRSCSSPSRVWAMRSSSCASRPRSRRAARA